MVTETDRDKARSAVVSAYHALDCVTIPFPFLHAFADAAVDAVSTDAEPGTVLKNAIRAVSEAFDPSSMLPITENQAQRRAIRSLNRLSALYAEPVKTAPAVAVPQILVNLATAVLAQAPANATEFMGIGLDDIRSALSAQVQDVAGWQPIETAPMGEAGKPETYFIGARQDGRRVNVHTCFRDQHGAYEFWGGGMTPTHWIPFPAASPASKHGDAE